MTIGTVSTVEIGVGVIVLLALMALVYFAYLGVENTDTLGQIAHYYEQSPWTRILAAVPVFGTALHEFLSSIPHTADPMLRKSAFKQLWGFNEDSSVTIVAPQLSDELSNQEPLPNQYLYLGKFGDIDSLVQVLISLSQSYPSADIEFYTDEEYNNMGRTLQTENLITIGGPGLNSITGSYINETPFQYRKNDAGEWVLKNNINGDTWEAESDSGNNIVDHGVFAKLPHPDDPSKRLIMIHGITTYGVFGSALAFASQNTSNTELNTDTALNNCKQIVEQLGADPNFAVRVETSAQGDRVSTPELNEHCIYTVAEGTWYPA